MKVHLDNMSDSDPNSPKSEYIQTKEDNTN